MRVVALYLMGGLLFGAGQEAQAMRLIEMNSNIRAIESFLGQPGNGQALQVSFTGGQEEGQQISYEALTPKLLKLRMRSDLSREVNAVGGALRKRFYTLCLGQSLKLADQELLIGWSAFLDSTRMMGSQSWIWFWYGASIWGKY